MASIGTLKVFPSLRLRRPYNSQLKRHAAENRPPPSWFSLHHLPVPMLTSTSSGWRHQSLNSGSSLPLLPRITCILAYFQLIKLLGLIPRAIPFAAPLSPRAPGTVRADPAQFISKTVDQWMVLFLLPLKSHLLFFGAYRKSCQLSLRCYAGCGQRDQAN